MRKRIVILLGISFLSVVFVGIGTTAYFKPSFLSGVLNSHLFKSILLQNKTEDGLEEKKFTSEKADTDQNSAQESLTEKQDQSAADTEMADTHAEDSSKDGKESSSEKPDALLPATDFVMPQASQSTIVIQMRKISFLLDRMAAGDKNVPRDLKASMISMAERIRILDPSKATSAEIQAAALFVLSGGDPGSLASLRKEDAISDDHTKLLDGVSAFATADFQNAADKLISIHVDAFEPKLVAQLKLTQAQLIAADDAESSVRLLAYAANLAPGTLIEEGAIRRIIRSLAASGNFQGFMYWTKRYIRRFQSSLYYDDFVTGAADAIVLLHQKGATASGPVYAELLRQLGPEGSAEMTRQILERFLAVGNSAGCSQISQSVAKVAQEQSWSSPEVDILLKICAVAEIDDEGLEILKSTDVSQFKDTTRSRLEKSITMGAEILQDGNDIVDTAFGPHPSLSLQEDFAPLFASVAQQLEASSIVIEKADQNETSNKQ